MAGIFTQRNINQLRTLGGLPGVAPLFVEYLVVAGGGGGGHPYAGGGGGAGGLLTGILPVTTGVSLTVTVGGGGAAQTATNGLNGTNSVFGSIIASGGGGGAGDNGSFTATVNGIAGGSGGGGNMLTANVPPGKGNGIVGQGNSSGTASMNGFGLGASGGGAGSVGLDSFGETNPANITGGGGAGVASVISGTVTTYAGGGGGGNNNSTVTNIPGGIGGGGAGGAYSGTTGGTAGTTNTGGGGGGGGNGSTGAAGGSGCVVVRYPGTTQFYTGGSVYTIGGYVVHRFLSSGTLAPTTPTPATAAPSVFGQSFQGGFYAGMIAVNGSGFPTHYLIVSPKSSGESTAMTWNTGGSAGGVGSDIDGPTNSAALNSSTYPAAQFCEAASIGGYTDWYLPAKNELEVCYYNLKPSSSTNNTGSGINSNAVPARASTYTSGNPAQTSATLFQSGQAQEFNEVNYWTSQGDPNIGNRAQVQSFYKGAQGSIYKATSGSNYRTRAVRRVAI
jgi:hypothetical protein